ncbi:MAG: glycoside hydrolase family 95 protein [Tannerella sp.]|jgi:alpha-L-fucosidase 2|nr:glycoside hydrolase family 95 protein [Tannerella sp.]
MKFKLLLFPVLSLLIACRQEKEESLTLWYNEPATEWNDALPVGNGQAGAMIFGGAGRELLQLNENTLYSGEPSVIFKDIKVTPESLEQAVSLLKRGDYAEAGEIAAKQWLGRLHQYYQPFGDLHIENNRDGGGEISACRRELNISEAIARTTFRQDGATYTREIFASHPDRVIIIRLTGDRPDGMDVTLRFDGPHPTASQSAGGNSCLLYKGKAPGYVERRTFEQIEAWGDRHKHPELYDGDGNRRFDKRVLYGEEIDGKGMLFEARLAPVLSGKGEIEITAEGGMRIHGTNDVYLILALATSFNGYDKSPSLEGVDPSEKTGNLLANALKYDYKTLKKRHTDDYKSLFDRVSLHLPSTVEQESLSTDERIIRFAAQPDPGLAALLYQYGRYLMISGSRPGGQPLNLQGMWNREVIPPWNCGYTQNINSEMNYWPAETANLPECHEPLFRLIRELSVTGRETARDMYGRRGWVAHHNTSIWRESLPNDNVPTASFWPMAQGWYSSHLWEHYLFTGDEQFLANEAYPILRGAAEFYADWLVDDGRGNLVTPAGISPENAFLTGKPGERAALSMGPTMDMSIIRETFTRTVRASEILHTDAALRDELNDKLARLLPYRIGARGQLQEWMHDFKEAEPKHRHISHLYGLYPGDQITPETAELFKAAETSLNLRGDEATGWSMGWKINCRARLLDGNRAYRIIRNLFNPTGFGPAKKDRATMGGGGLYKSLLDAHPPFQIDGNFGYTAGVTEMLLQSHAGYIQLLPALPDAWPEGHVSGLKARGNFELSFRWTDSQLQEATIRSLAGKPCCIRTSVPVTVSKGKTTVTRSEPVTSNGKTCYRTSFPTEKNEVFKLTPCY